MKRIIVSVLVIVVLLFNMSAICEQSTDDYSWLDDLTIKQLKELDNEIHKRIPYETSDSQSSISESQAEKEESQIEITADNFLDYFNVSASSSNVSLTNKSQDWMGITSYKYSGNVDMTIEARYPCEIHNVSFNAQVEAYLGASSGSRYPQFNGVISQSGSYSSSNSISWETKYSMEDHITVMSPIITTASGYIVITE